MESHTWEVTPLFPFKLAIKSLSRSHIWEVSFEAVVDVTVDVAVDVAVDVTVEVTVEVAPDVPPEVTLDITPRATDAFAIELARSQIDIREINHV